MNSYYPTKSDMISDRPTSDAGSNFGRFARSGAMDGYMKELFEDRLAGIQLWAWQRFLSLFTASHSAEDVSRALDGIADDIAKQGKKQISEDRRAALSEKFREISEILVVKGG